eukprot:CAMPEP_0202474026 /NCGR_PEP_ID=MMETSP1360-20130828/92162_1 /ASSEMBLY_ACC=CAM_ASM_000848 /TAXON_ID=515479 /ORGANISM="Licmophora paradoxa, Strain CCMP2313" /LENGTH=101 /DNA_ID=CAMNT_0049101121 /DNA_START=61 /DNA_END=366 /DNA_ORIENTATION=+
MPTIDNTTEQPNKRQRTSTPSESKPPTNIPPMSPKGSSPLNIVQQLQQIIETEGEIWGKNKTEVIESLTLYAHEDLTAKRITHLQLKAKIDQEQEAAKKRK